VRDNGDMPDLSAEDKKLVTLARATRARIQAPEGAAVRDPDGRTYAAATVDLPSLQLTAVQAVVAMAVASGSTGVEACVVLGEAQDLTEQDASVLRDFAAPDGVTVHVGDARGAIHGTRAH
jgi:cytidine deaminase